MGWGGGSSCKEEASWKILVFTISNSVGLVKGTFFFFNCVKCSGKELLFLSSAQLSPAGCERSAGLRELAQGGRSKSSLRRCYF